MNTPTARLLLLLISCLPAAIVGQSFSSEQLQEDAALLWQALNELHPGLYRHQDTATITAAYEQLRADFASPRSAEEALLAFCGFTAQIKCGHTYPNPFNQENGILDSLYQRYGLLPFTFQLVGDKMVVTEPLHPDLKPGYIISAIDGMSVKQIVDRLSKYVKADGDRDNKRKIDLSVSAVSKHEYFDYLYPLVFQPGLSVKLTYAATMGTPQREMEVDLISKKERNQLLAQQRPTATFNNYDHLWNYEIVDGRYAYLQLGTFVTWRLTFDWEEYLNQFFEEVATKNIPNLLLDIRGNEGGLTEVTHYLLNKIANKEGYRVMRRPHLNYKKVSDDLRPHLRTWNKRLYNNWMWTKKMGPHYRTIRFSSGRRKTIRPKKDAYQGETYLLIDASNSSATFSLAESCKLNNYATLIGVETGGSKMGITGGQLFFLTLPNTRIEVDIPLIGYYPMEEQVDEGIQPDLVITPTLSDVLTGKDLVLEEAIKQIQ